MNARKKCKQLKKELSFFKSNTINPVILRAGYTHKHYIVSQTVEEGYLWQISDDVDCPQIHVYNALKKQLVDRLSEDMKFEIRPSSIPGHVDIVADVFVEIKE